jgi:hypothetical protein
VVGAPRVFRGGVCFGVLRDVSTFFGELGSHNAKLTGTFYGERFCEKMKQRGMHKNEHSKMFPCAAFC